MTARRNLITDVAGLRVGNAEDARLRSGVTVLLPEAPCVAAVDVRGGGPGTRETDAIALASTVERVHAIVLSGGSAFGLDAATGAQAWLRGRGIGFAVGGVKVPIVPQAILFDLLNGGDKAWGRRPPYQDMAWQACDAAAADFALGTAGAGYGATTENLKGGLGSASHMTPEGFTVGALVAVNAMGRVTIADTHHFWAAPFERDREFGGHGWPARLPAPPEPALKGGVRANTTIAIVATDATLSHAGAQRLAMMAQTGLARAIHPVHAPLDGDTVFALATAKAACADEPATLARLGAHAADTLARAVARAVYTATALPDGPAAYCERFP
ncbi:MAG: P1 family peptidase [Hyphomicrobiaceae bacterium]|nr:P1 family peptidase [Hyphomicrobiaceae bacterium]